MKPNKNNKQKEAVKKKKNPLPPNVACKQLALRARGSLRLAPHSAGYCFSFLLPSTPKRPNTPTHSQPTPHNTPFHPPLPVSSFADSWGAEGRGAAWSGVEGCILGLGLCTCHGSTYRSSQWVFQKKTPRMNEKKILLHRLRVSPPTA